LSLKRKKVILLNTVKLLNILGQLFVFKYKLENYLSAVFFFIRILLVEPIMVSTKGKIPVPLRSYTSDIEGIAQRLLIEGHICATG